MTPMRVLLTYRTDSPPGVDRGQRGVEPGIIAAPRPEHVVRQRDQLAQGRRSRETHTSIQVERDPLAALKSDLAGGDVRQQGRVLTSDLLVAGQRSRGIERLPHPVHVVPPIPERGSLIHGPGNGAEVRQGEAGDVAASTLLVEGTAPELEIAGTIVPDHLVRVLVIAGPIAGSVARQEQPLTASLRAARCQVSNGNGIGP